MQTGRSKSITSSPKSTPSLDNGITLCKVVVGLKNPCYLKIKLRIFPFIFFSSFFFFFVFSLGGRVRWRMFTNCCSPFLIHRKASHLCWWKMPSLAYCSQQVRSTRILLHAWVISRMLGTTWLWCTKIFHFSFHWSTGVYIHLCVFRYFQVVHFQTSLGIWSLIFDGMR